jgi:hypothetical protein
MLAGMSGVETDMADLRAAGITTNGHLIQHVRECHLHEPRRRDRNE